MKKTSYLLLVILSLVSSITAGEQTPKSEQNYKIYVTAKDIDIFSDYVSKFTDKQHLTIADLIIETGKYFLETPYVGHTLEIEPEGLVINLRELDCTTFLENVYALSFTIKQGDPTFKKYLDNLRNIRYREGIISNYASRLHYTSDWMHHNQLKGHIKDITAESGGKELSLNLFIMSTNHDRYKQLKGEPELTSQIDAIEKEASKRPFYHIPKNEIENNRHHFKNGDMVGFVTTTKGIDLSHVGIIYFQGDKLTFLHASSGEMKVVIEELTLQQYCNRFKTNNGIVVARPL